MTLPASGPISFNAINLELGLSGTATKSINDSDYRSLAAVASGLIDLQDFYGKSAVSITISDLTVNNTDVNPAIVDSTYQLNSDGRIYDNSVNIGNWVTPTGSASGYQAKAEIVSGSPTGTFSTWLNLSTSRSWIVSRDGSISGVGTTTAVISVSIRDTATSTVRDTATITLQAQLTT